MALLKTDFAKGVKQSPNVGGAEGVPVRFEYSLAAALALNDIIHMGDMPAGMTMVDCLVDSDDLDTNATPLIVLQAGILNTAKTDIDNTKSGGASWIGSSTIAQAGGLARASDKAVSRVPVDETNDLPIGIKVSTGPATGATTGKVGLTVWMRSAHYDL